MNKIVFYQSKAGYQGFQALGHTNYAQHGEDIVCAAISAITQTALLGLVEVLEIECAVELDHDKGLLACYLPKGLSKELWQQAQLILKVLYHGLENIAMNDCYKKYVSLKEVPYHEN